MTKRITLSSIAYKYGMTYEKVGNYVFFENKHVEVCLVMDGDSCAGLERRLLYRIGRAVANGKACISEKVYI